jgi:hypothetical protein
MKCYRNRGLLVCSRYKMIRSNAIHLATKREHHNLLSVYWCESVLCVKISVYMYENDRGMFVSLSPPFKPP